MIRGSIFVGEDRVSEVNRIILHLISSVKEIKQEDVKVGVPCFRSHDQVKLLIAEF